MKQANLFFLTLSILIIATNVAFAQPPGLPAIPDQAPIDGGLSILAVAGGAYAIKKLRNKKSK